MMKDLRKIHPDFMRFLKFKDKPLILLYKDLRNYILEMSPECNELLYHTHALTSLYSVSEKMGDAFCMIPIYTAHLNLGFNKGALLDDPDQLLQGTGKLIRHIPIKSSTDFRNKNVKSLIKNAIEFAVSDISKPPKTTSQTISKIKK